jgi:hypothetical protein
MPQTDFIIPNVSIDLCNTHKLEMELPLILNTINLYGVIPDLQCSTQSLFCTTFILFMHTPLRIYFHQVNSPQNAYNLIER